MSLRNRVAELPLKISTQRDPEYLVTATTLLCEVFYLSLDRFAHQDKAVNTMLRIRAYEYRLKNFLAYVLYVLQSQDVREKLDEPRKGTRHMEDTEWGHLHYI